MILSEPLKHLVHLLLFIQRVLARSRVDEQEEATNDGEDLEEIVLGEVLVWVCVVELLSVSFCHLKTFLRIRVYLQPRSY